MIELRWLERGDGHNDSPIERTLQYRVREYQDGFGILPSSFGKWLEWQDVPSVTRTDAAPQPAKEGK